MNLRSDEKKKLQILHIKIQVKANVLANRFKNMQIDELQSKINIRNIADQIEAGVFRPDPKLSDADNIANAQNEIERKAALAPYSEELKPSDITMERLTPIQKKARELELIKFRNERSPVGKAFDTLSTATDLPVLRNIIGKERLTKTLADVIDKQFESPTDKAQKELDASIAKEAKIAKEAPTEADFLKRINAEVDRKAKQELKKTSGYKYYNSAEGKKDAADIAKFFNKRTKTANVSNEQVKEIQASEFNRLKQANPNTPDNDIRRAISERLKANVAIKTEVAKEQQKQQNKLNLKLQEAGSRIAVAKMNNDTKIKLAQVKDKTGLSDSVVNTVLKGMLEKNDGEFDFSVEQEFNVWLAKQSNK